MKYLIIGLGIYGENLARDLSAAGNEVIGADANPSIVESLKNDISTVYVVDSTDENQLSVLPLHNVDLVIVAIGENFGASIKTVALLKKAGVKHIYARGIDTIHEAILSSFEIDRIITPEQRAAADLTNELELGEAARTMRIDSDRAIVQLVVPDFLVGAKYSDVTEQLRHDFGMTLVAVSRPQQKTNVLGIKRPRQEPLDIDSSSAAAGDLITICGLRKNIHSMFKN